MRFPGKWPAINDSPNDRSRERQFTLDRLRDRGTARRPQPPRDLICQPAPRGVFLTWALPTVYFDIQGWRVYKGDENTLYHDLADQGVRKLLVDASAGTPSSQTISLFVSSVNGLGKESAKIQAFGAPAPEANAPPMPGVPPGYNNGFSGGGNTNKYQGRFWYQR